MCTILLLLNGWSYNVIFCVQMWQELCCMTGVLCVKLNLATREVEIIFGIALASEEVEKSL